MYKLILFVICSSLCQSAFSQSEKMEIEGAMILGNTEVENPKIGTIRWSGQDFEGFDGAEWKSLTHCGDDPFSTNAVLSCPSNVVLDNCNLTVNWTHDNPVSSTVNYDLRLYHVSNPNGVDPGPSVTYPAKSNTVSICDPQTLGINSGTGSIDVELLYWYDGDTNAQISAGSCTVNYDLGSNNTECMTYAEIKAAGRPENCYPLGIDYADIHLAEFLYLNPEVSNWSNDPTAEVICALPDPEPSSNAVVMPPSQSNNDAVMIENFLAAHAGGEVIGSGPYNIGSTVDISSPVKIWDMSTSATGNVVTIFRVTAPNVEFYRSPIDANNLASAAIG